MALQFEAAEYRARIARLIDRLKADGLAGILLFRQESMYYLTGYDTAGYSQFQGLYLGIDGRMVLLTRSSDVRQARLTSIIEDVRLWVDRAGANPAETLRDAIADRLSPHDRIGVEYASTTLNAQRGKLLDAAFEGVARLEDTSELVSSLRVTKSATELAYVRRAGELVDAAWLSGLAACSPGNSESDMLADIYSTILRGGGDPAAGRYVCGAGENALLCRYFTGKGTIAPVDQVNVEFAAGYRHYHVALMRTALTGTPSPEHLRMHAAVVEALQACQQVLVPGRTYGDLFDAHAEVLDRHGYQHARLNACGYSLGAAYPPTWMEWPMVFTGNPVVLEPGMVVFLHMILLDSDTGKAMALGETYVVTEGAPERLSRLDYNLPLRP